MKNIVTFTCPFACLGVLTGEPFTLRFYPCRLITAHLVQTLTSSIHFALFKEKNVHSNSSSFEERGVSLSVEALPVLRKEDNSNMKVS